MGDFDPKSNLEKLLLKQTTSDGTNSVSEFSNERQPFSLYLSKIRDEWGCFRVGPFRGDFLQHLYVKQNVDSIQANRRIVDMVIRTKKSGRSERGWQNLEGMYTKYNNTKWTTARWRT